jgi:uncharacterized membrane protein YphA (DoxX/SURF4 family)
VTTLAAIRNGWNRFFFEPESPLPIAVYRIVLGLVVLFCHALLLPETMDWFGHRGIVSPETALKLSGGGGLNLLRILPPTDASVWFVLAVSCAAAISVTIGFFTRASTVVLFLTLISLHHRNTLILMSADSFLRIATFYLIFSQAGAALSVDRWRRARRGFDQGPPRPAAPWAMRLIQLQLSFLYLHAFVWKAMGTMWLDGTALYYTARLPEFWRFPVPYMLEHMWTIQWSTWLTLVVEFALGTLVWIKELRYPVLLAGVLLHAGIEYSMNIPLFGMVMVSAYITFIEPAHLERCVNWLRARKLIPANLY